MKTEKQRVISRLRWNLAQIIFGSFAVLFFMPSIGRVWSTGTTSFIFLVFISVSIFLTIRGFLELTDIICALMTIVINEQLARKNADDGNGAEGEQAEGCCGKCRHTADGRGIVIDHDPDHGKPTDPRC